MLMMMMVLAALDQTILATALPAIAADLPANWPTPWVFAAYLLSATVVVTLYGRLADVFGRKPMLLGAVALFLVGSLACGFSRDLQQLVLARALQGAGGGGLMTLSMLAIIDLYPLEQRGRYQAMLGAAYSIATMFGPLFGGWLVEHLSWHWAFWLNVPLAGMAVVVLARSLPRVSPARRTAVDFLGALLLSGALMCLLLATQRHSVELPFGVSAVVILLLGLKLLGAFIWRQRKAVTPLVPLSLFTRRAYAATALISAVSGLALYAAVVFVPQYLQMALHQSPIDASWPLLALMFGITLGSQLSGRMLRAVFAVSRRASQKEKPMGSEPAATVPADSTVLVRLMARVRSLSATSGVLMALSFAGLTMVLWRAPQVGVWLAVCLLPLGIGLGLLFPLVMVVSQHVSDSRDMGVATAVPIMLRSLGGAGGVALLAMWVDSLLATSAIAATPMSTAWAQALAAVFSGAGGVSLVVVLASRWLDASES